jgi:hypothetical protein
MLRKGSYRSHNFVSSPVSVLDRTCLVHATLDFMQWKFKRLDRTVHALLLCKQLQTLNISYILRDDPTGRHMRRSLTTTRVFPQKTIYSYCRRPFIAISYLTAALGCNVHRRFKVTGDCTKQSHSVQSGGTLMHAMGSGDVTPLVLNLNTSLR